MRLPVAHHHVVADIILNGEDQLLCRAVTLAVRRLDPKLQAVVAVKGIGTVGIACDPREVGPAGSRVSGQGGCGAYIADLTAVFVERKTGGIGSATDVVPDRILLRINGRHGGEDTGLALFNLDDIAAGKSRGLAIGKEVVVFDASRVVPEAIVATAAIKPARPV